MDEKILNKIDKSLLTKIDTNLKVNKDEIDLSQKVKDVVTNEDEPYTPPCIHPAIHNYINLNQFSVNFDKPCFIESDNVISVSKPVFNIRKGKYATHKIMLGFEMIHSQHYFGKPSKYDNFYTDDEVIKLAECFNNEKCAYMEVYEYDQNGVAKNKATYTAPRIYRLEFSAFDKNKEGVKKYFMAEVHFNNVTYSLIDEQELTEHEIEIETLEK